MQGHDCWHDCFTAKKANTVCRYGSVKIVGSGLLFLFLTHTAKAHADPSISPVALFRSALGKNGSATHLLLSLHSYTFPRA